MSTPSYNYANTYYPLSYDHSDNDKMWVKVNDTSSATITSSNYDMSRVTQVSSTVYGGYSYICAYKSGSSSGIDYGISLGVTIKVSVIGVKSDGTTATLKTASGGATSSGVCKYAKSTSDSLTYTPTSSDKTTYKYICIKYECTPTSTYVEDSDIASTSNDWGGKQNPYGVATITLTDNIPVTFDSTTLQTMTMNSTTVGSLIFDGTTIY